MVNYWDKYTEMHGQQNVQTFKIIYTIVGWLVWWDLNIRADLIIKQANTQLYKVLLSVSKDKDLMMATKKTKLRGLSPHANYTDRAAAAGRRS